MGIIEEMQAEIEELKERVTALETKERLRKAFTKYREMKAKKKTLEESHDDLLRIFTEKKQKQKKRDEIIEKAKRDVEELKKQVECEGYRSFDTYVVFLIDRKHRRVGALIKVKSSFQPINGTPLSMGSAYCHPDDCFNIHIGKAIALRRALGLEVPDEYLNVPQPTEIRIGDVVRNKNTGLIYEVVHENRKIFIGKEKEFEIIDDSGESVIEC